MPAKDVIADVSANLNLKHSAGGTTTRDDSTDVGVPMKQGDPSEPQGPEDALGRGPKRGDYRTRIGPDSYHPHEVVAVDNPEPGKPIARVEAQRPRADEIGEEKGVKGGTA
jgi:hypothetical protein